MNRELTTREKTLLLVLAVLVIALGYWKLVLEPINEQVASYNDMAEQEQAEIDSSVVQLAQMRKMQKAVEAQKEAGEVRAIPSYDNSGILMRELYQILANTNEYTVDFSAATSREGYIVLRPVSLTFQTGTYEQARAIINAIGGSDNLNQISDVNIRAGQGASRSAVQTSLTITYFEVAS